VFDLALFDVLKWPGQYRFPFGDEKRSAELIKRVYRDFRRTTIEMNMWGAFQETGLTCITIDAVQRVVYNEMKLRENRGIYRRDANVRTLKGSTSFSKQV
jgi:hypothetical protein